MTLDFRINYEGDWKYFRSPNYNYSFNLKDGTFARWGDTENNDPKFSPFGPEILDFEISESCSGSCPYCYKDNKPNGKNASFETFKSVIEKINPNNTLTQVAFGLGMTGTENSNLSKMCDWLKSNNIIPNGTVANITEETGKWLAENFGACAVSVHHHWNDWKEIFANSVYYLTKYGMEQTNCHFVLAQETLPVLYQLLELTQTDSRLFGLNAIVLLSIKQCGRAAKGNYHRVSDNDFNSLCGNMLDLKTSIGFDSCSAKRFEQFLETKPEYKHLSVFVEPCESGLFSVYANVDGVIHPCSFSEVSELAYNVLERNDFIDYWNSSEWRKKLLANNRHCPIYTI